MRAGWSARVSGSPAAADSAELLVVTALVAPLFAAADVESALDDVYLGTTLPLVGLDGGDWQVALPGARTGWLARPAGEARPRAAPYPQRPVARVVAEARRLLGSPYLWGGGTVHGIDCSALVQLAYRVSGYSLPRDADQQWAALPTAVEREGLAAGDLLFFARQGAIVHVALALGGTAYLHALGEPPLGVCIQSFDPAAPDYNARLDALYLGARRVVG